MALLFLVGCASSAQLRVTPGQPEGPYYPVDLPQETDNDLVLVGDGPAADGNILYLDGRVLSASGTAIAGARVEIWQTDPSGIYLHPSAPRTEERDSNFQFFGTSTTDADGHYSFRTLLPGRYRPRRPHIHFKVFVAEQNVLTSQFYFDESLEQNDRLTLALAEASIEGIAVSVATMDIVRP